jgi:hypothetical protein
MSFVEQVQEMRLLWRRNIPRFLKVRVIPVIAGALKQNYFVCNVIDGVMHYIYGVMHYHFSAS